MAKNKALKKELGLLDVYAIATATTISGGFFILPGLAVSEAGSNIITCYLLAILPMIPALFSMTELATAMPRAGGLYYFIDRSMGPLVGTIGGMGTWLALILKTAFALVGMGAYLRLVFPEIPMIPLAVGLAVLFGILNLFGAKKTGLFQVILLFGLLLILTWFSVAGVGSIHTPYFADFGDVGLHTLVSVSGLVVVSYVGLTKAVSVAEEVKNPERTLPLGIFFGLITSVIIYGIGTYVMVGVIPPDLFRGNLTPTATAAEAIGGGFGKGMMITAAILAFVAVANAVILSASRYPLAMSRDHILPRFFRKLSKGGTPATAIQVTVALTVAILLLLDPTKIAKLASAFLLIIFSLNNLAVIVMRESRIDSYDPGYRSPFYPYMHVVGIIVPLAMIREMGALAILFTSGMIIAGLLFYLYYAAKRTHRGGAIYHMFARWGEQRFEGLDRELRGILKEKGLRDADPFDTVIAQCAVLDYREAVDFERVVRDASLQLARRIGAEADKLEQEFLQGTRIGATPVSHCAALPHARIAGLDHPDLVMVRCAVGVTIEVDPEISLVIPEKPVLAFFFLVSPEENPGQHLRILAQIAGHVDGEEFMNKWAGAANQQELKELMLRDDSFISLRLLPGGPAEVLIGKTVQELSLPPNALITLIHRQGQFLLPHGKTLLQAGDRLTIIGYPRDIAALYATFGSPIINPEPESSTS
ncbi:MAG TPA: amino acid permease [Calditrichia bacterium]|nr:amino acid permease [Calditrichia bacterium]